jgi:hypothetical protein
MIETLDITVDPVEILEYKQLLDTNFKHYHWEYVKHHNDGFRSVGAHNCLKSMHGYGLQTIYNDLTFPYHCDIDPHDEGPEYFKDTELVFGFFKELKDKFPNVFRSFLMTFPPENYISKWSPGPIKQNRIIVPIQTNNTKWLKYYVDGTSYEISPTVGKVYQLVLDKDKTFASVTNDGDTDISFIMFNSI